MRSENQTDTPWISIADMMTALMVIFMFIALNFIMQMIEHRFIQDEIYNQLSIEFENEIQNHKIELSPDGSIRFNSPQDEELFNKNSEVLTKNFEVILYDFLPRYWEVLKSDESYLEFIKEIRIEGHADTTCVEKKGKDCYLFNLDLSSRRAASVLKFFRNQPFFLMANDSDKERMEFLFTAIGFSSSRAINEENEFVYLSKNKSPSNIRSRRVEFRIVTSNEKLIDKLTKIQ